MSDTWRALTEADCLPSLSGPENRIYRERLLASGQADPLPEIMEQVTLQIRNAIRSHGGNTLHADQSFLPRGAIMHAKALVRYDLLSRLAVGSDDQPGEARTNQWREANKWLDLVRSGKELIEAPEGTGTETASSEIEVGSNVPPRKWTRRQQSGL